jgi:hypothetical protein
MNAQEAQQELASPVRVATILAAATLVLLVECRLTLTRASGGWHVATLAAVILAGSPGRATAEAWRKNHLVGRPWAQWALSGMIFFVAIDSSDVWFGVNNAPSAPHLLALLAFAAIWAVVVGWLSEGIRRRRAADRDADLPTPL